MRKLLASSLLAVLLLAATAGPATSAGSTTVRLRDNVFAPKSKTVSKRTRVTFRWAGSNPHNVVVTSGPVRFSSKVKRSGTYRRTMTRSGTYRIVCTIHAGMALRLRVR